MGNHHLWGPNCNHGAAAQTTATDAAEHAGHDPHADCGAPKGEDLPREHVAGRKAQDAEAGEAAAESEHRVPSCGAASPSVHESYLLATGCCDHFRAPAKAAADAAEHAGPDPQDECDEPQPNGLMGECEAAQEVQDAQAGEAAAKPEQRPLSRGAVPGATAATAAFADVAVAAVAAAAVADHARLHGSRDRRHACASAWVPSAKLAWAKTA
mmetsp:Transcript_66685/g.203992  ORF Transcript_66685/g.203992 Transcript_66685/m.203992 type:complete len:212 (-) Transcript_66685:21-656(-)